MKSQSTGKAEKRKPPPTAWKKGQSGNPGGRPKNQQSITHWLNEYGNETPRALAASLTQYASDLKKVKGDMTMFAHIAIRALMSQINEPSPGLLAQILERTEGRVDAKITLSGDPNAPLQIKAFEYGTAVAQIAPGPGDDSAAPGESESHQLRAPVGQNGHGG